MADSRKLRVFLCHASDDKPRVRDLFKKLALEYWIDAWLDEEKLLPGQKWKVEIPKAVRTADVVIVCLSTKSVSKEGYVQRELKYALDMALEKPDETIFLIPLRLEDCSVPESFKDLHWINLFSNVDKKAYERLRKSLIIRATSLGIRTGVVHDYSSEQSSKKNNQPATTISAPEKTLEYLNNVRVVYFDTFDDPSRGGWGFDIGKIKDGELEIIGENWRGFSRSRYFVDNEGIVVDFTYTKGAEFIVVVTNGDWSTDPLYKRFGVNFVSNQARIDKVAGKDYIGRGNLLGNFTLQPDTAYRLLMAILPNGVFLEVIWDISDPSKAISHRESSGESWANLMWKLEFVANLGVIVFDNYTEIIFDSSK